MSKIISIGNRRELDELFAKIEETAQSALENLSELARSGASMEIMAKLKFDKIGFDPINPVRPLNLIEQINQTFTYIASLRATCRLQELHPDAKMFTLNLGTTGGTDIESDDCGGIAAEVFAAVTPLNNSKLKKDIRKVASAEGLHKYVFFMSPGYDPGRQADDPQNPDVIIESLGPYSARAGSDQAN